MAHNCGFYREAIAVFCRTDRSAKSQVKLNVKHLISVRERLRVSAVN